MGQYPQHFIFFLTYEYFQQARELDYTRPENVSLTNPSLVDQFATYEEIINKVLWIPDSKLAGSIPASQGQSDQKF